MMSPFLVSYRVRGVWGHLCIKLAGTMSPVSSAGLNFSLLILDNTQLQAFKFLNFALIVKLTTASLFLISYIFKHGSIQILCFRFSSCCCCCCRSCYCFTYWSRVSSTSQFFIWPDWLNVSQAPKVKMEAHLWTPRVEARVILAMITSQTRRIEALATQPLIRLCRVGE